MKDIDLERKMMNMIDHKKKVLWFLLLSPLLKVQASDQLLVEQGSYPNQCAQDLRKALVPEHDRARVVIENVLISVAEEGQIEINKCLEFFDFLDGFMDVNRVMGEYRQELRDLQYRLRQQEAARMMNQMSLYVARYLNQEYGISANNRVRNRG